MTPAAPAKPRPRPLPRRPRPVAADPTPLEPRDGPRRRFRMSREEYEAFEAAQADAKFEWVDGEAIEMPRVTLEHSDICTTLSALLWFAMRGRSGKVHHADLRLRTRDGAGPNRYADVSVVLGEDRFARHPEDKKLDLLNPTVVVEVLSESTAGDDESGRKFEDYAATPSVTDYVLADSRSMRVLHRARTGPDAEWAETELTGPADALELPARGFAATLAEIYEGVAL